MPVPGERDTSATSYTERLQSLGSVGWKRLLDVQAPYRWNVRRLLGGRRTVDVGCGIGRNLRHLDEGSVGVDHNPSSVEVCRSRGMVAYETEEFWASAEAVPGRFEGLLAAHLVEHLSREDAAPTLEPYLRVLARGSRVVIICPQERGYGSDTTHRQFFDDSGLRALGTELGLRVERQISFPFPRRAGRWFTYNEFVTIART